VPPRFVPPVPPFVDVPPEPPVDDDESSSPRLKKAQPRLMATAVDTSPTRSKPDICVEP
jgi:hypothetical protein